MLATARVVPSAVHIQNYPLPVLCWREVLSGFEKGIKKRMRKQTLAEGQIQNANKFLKDGAGHTIPRRTNHICGTWRPGRQNGKIDTVLDIRSKKEW